MNKRLMQTLKRNQVGGGYYIDAYNQTVSKDICGTITTRISESNCYFVCVEEEVMEDIRKIGNYGNGHHAKDVYDPKGVAPTITTGNHGLGQTIAIKNNTQKGYLEAENGDGINICGRMEHQRGNVQKGLAQTINTRGGEDIGTMQNLRIRKLVPIETVRLMGFEDSDYQAMRDIGMSDSAIFHCCGDSIVVPVLISIFSTMFPQDNHIEIVDKYVKGVVGK